MRKIFPPALSVLILLVVLFFGCAGTKDISLKTYDVVIQNGTVYDGSGDLPYKADIGIKNGYISAIGMVYPDADIIIDAEGKYVSPGFIDIHTHCSFRNKDKDIEELTRSAANYLYQGVTTVVGNNCGSGTTETAESIKYTEKHGAGPNMVHLIGHGSVRNAVMQDADREPTSSEMEEMKQIVRDAMEAGAFGMSTGLYYAPGCYAETEEVIELARIVKEYGGIYATHIRDEGSNNTGGLIKSIKEAIRIGEEVDIPVEISHIKGMGKNGWHKAEEVTRLIEEAQARGLKICADQYPYRAASTNLGAVVVPRWVQADGKMIERLKDPEQIDRIKKEIAERIDRYNGAQSLQIASYKKNPEYDGKNLREIADELDKDPVDTAVEMIINGNPSIVIFAMLQEEVEYFMQKPYIMTGSDGANIVYGRGIPHPRHYGAFTHKIRHYSIEKGILSMEEVIRKATSLPADMLGLLDRGLIKAGYAGDILVFDPEKIDGPATFSDPNRYGTGIEYMLINGRPVIVEGLYNNALEGKPLKHKKTGSQITQF